MAIRRKEKRSERSKLDATPPWEPRKPVEVAKTTGPFDAADAPDDDIERVDLGALRVPAGTMELRVDVADDHSVVSVTLVDEAKGHMQLAAFAAPRSEGIWDDVRTEIRGSIGSQGGTAQEEDGEFGQELSGKLPGDGGFAPVRFIGVNGPRWLLRAMIGGPAATDQAKAAPFVDLLKQVVVVRGSDPLPVRDAIPLRLPAEITQQIAAAAAEE